MNKIRVLVVSQQSLLRHGIEHSLGSTEGMEIIGSVELNDAALADIETSPPDVAVVDVDGYNGYGLSLARRIRQRSPNIGVVLLTSTPNDDQLFQALKVQAAACLDKEVGTDELIAAVERTARGEHPINESLAVRPRVAEKVLSQFQKLAWQKDAEDIMSPLTPREIEILNYIAKGYLNKQIAIELGISEQTIKNHVTSILRKLNANARTEAVVLAIKQGVISIN
ncbi:MAG: response regulator transcription factor [Dehalococcoidales bacterium]|nr:response regulator transcription factor [Dehalococcoidales bacterium]